MFRLQSGLKRVASKGLIRRGFNEMVSSKEGSEGLEVLFSSELGVRKVTLNRPKKLNAIIREMSQEISKRLIEYEKLPSCSLVLLKGNGKAFCAGGDVLAIANYAKYAPNGHKDGVMQLGIEYSLCHLIATFTKPIVTFMNGFTMGGGAGMSVHSKFPVATEKTVFAMPESLIGFIPDVGSSFFLSRLDGHLGEYLALTGNQLTGYEVYLAGLASHYVLSENLIALEQRLVQLDNPSDQVLDNVISEFAGPESIDKSSILFGRKRAIIDQCFQFETVPKILEALKRVSSSFAQKTMETIESRSKLSCVLALDEIKKGRNWSIDEAFARENVLVYWIIQNNDFVQGVEAKLLYKTEPNFSTKSYDQVCISDYTAKLPEDLVFRPIANREYTDYTEKPYQNFRLPTEERIMGLLKNLKINSFDEALNLVIKNMGYRQGTRHKVKDLFERKLLDFGSKI